MKLNTARNQYNRLKSARVTLSPAELGLVENALRDRLEKYDTNAESYGMIADMLNQIDDENMKARGSQ